MIVLYQAALAVDMARDATQLTHHFVPVFGPKFATWRDGGAAPRRFSVWGRALNKWLEPKSPEAKLLDGLIEPQSFPGWMSESDLAIYADAFRAGGFRGPLNRYRAQAIDFGELAELRRTEHCATINLHRRRA